jgi:RNA polymerase sigma factor (sigma-70 family)
MTTVRDEAASVSPQDAGRDRDREQGGDSTADRGEPADAVERQISALLQQEDWNGAILVAEQSFGAEIHGYLRAVLRDAALAEEALQAFRLALVKGVRTFKQSCEFRIWAYVIAKHETLRVLRRRGRTRPLDSGRCDQIPARSSTRDWDKSINLRKMDCVRAQLSEDERELLVLRVDRRMSWEEVACIVSTPERPVKANTLAKQLSRTTARARELAAELPKDCGTPACPCGRWQAHD